MISLQIDNLKSKLSRKQTNIPIVAGDHEWALSFSRRSMRIEELLRFDASEEHSAGTSLQQ